MGSFAAPGIVPGGYPVLSGLNASGLGLTGLNLPAVATSAMNASMTTDGNLKALMAQKERELREVSEYRAAMLEVALSEKVRN